MNVGAYIIIFSVGAALMIIGFWIGYIYRATHGPDPLTPEKRGFYDVVKEIDEALKDDKDAPKV